MADDIDLQAEAGATSQTEGGGNNAQQAVAARRVRRSITTGLLPDRMLSGELLPPPASLNDFANAPVRESIPYTADAKTAVRHRAREMAKLYGEESGTYLNFVVRPGRVSAAFYPREAHLLGESVRDMIGNRGGDNYIWCERALSECYIVVVMDGEVRTDISQPQQNAGQEVRQWLFTLRRHLSQAHEARKAADPAADDDEASDQIATESSSESTVDGGDKTGEELPQMPQLFLRNIMVSDLGISGSTAAHVETIDQDILEWCWDNPDHLYPLLPSRRALRQVFLRESRWLRTFVFYIAGGVALVTGSFYIWTMLYQHFQAKETAQQLAEAQHTRSLLDDAPEQDEGSEQAVVEPVDEGWDNSVNLQLDEFLAGQRDAGVLLHWVLQSLLDLGSDVNSDSGGKYSFHRLMQSAVWSTRNNLLIVHTADRSERITRLHEVVSNDPDFPYSVRSYSARRNAGILDLQRNPAREVPRLNEAWLERREPSSLDDAGDIAAADYEELLLLDSELVAGEDGDGELLGGALGDEKPSLPPRQEWLLREWVLLLSAVNGQNIRLYEEQREHHRLYEVRADLPAMSFAVWRWFGQILRGRAVLLRHLELSFGAAGQSAGSDPQLLRGHIRLGIALPLRVGDPLTQVPLPSVPILPLPDPVLEDDVRQKVIAERESDASDRAVRGRRRGGARRR